MSGNPDVPIVVVLKCSNIHITPKRRAVFLDVFYFSLPCTCFFQGLLNLPGYLFWTFIGRSIYYCNLFSYQFAGIISKHLFKFRISVNNNGVFGPGKNHTLSHIIRDFRLQTQCFFRILVYVYIYARNFTSFIFIG